MKERLARISNDYKIITHMQILFPQVGLERRGLNGDMDFFKYLIMV